MPLQGLIASSYAPLVERIVPCLDVAGIEASICAEAKDARRRLQTEKYDAVMVDCESLADGRGALRQVRQSPSNRNCVTFAIAEGVSAEDAPANFLLSPHFTSERLLEALQCARSLMLAEQFRYYRHPVNLTALLCGSSRTQEHTALISNLSQGGMAIKPAIPLSLGSRVELRFQLPGTKPILAEAKVIWTAAEAGAGVEFTRVTREAKESLVSWLSEQWVQASEPLPPIPLTLGEPPRREFNVRLLRCHAFLRQLPVGWRCTHCQWQIRIPVQESSWKYENNPPRAILDAFEQHVCGNQSAEPAFRL